jgi:hypothetical protein
MSDLTYASGLADALIHLLASVRTKKKRKQTSSTFFARLKADARSCPALVEYGKTAMKTVISPFAMLR